MAIISIKRQVGDFLWVLQFLPPLKHKQTIGGIHGANNYITKPTPSLTEWKKNLNTADEPITII
jgi:hypothetical protein